MIFISRKGENIRKRHDGRWEGRYIVSYDEDAGYTIGVTLFPSRYIDNTVGDMERCPEDMKSLKSFNGREVGKHETYFKDLEKGKTYQLTYKKGTQVSSFETVADCHALSRKRGDSYHNTWYVVDEGYAVLCSDGKTSYFKKSGYYSIYIDGFGDYGKGNYMIKYIDK